MRMCSQCNVTPGTPGDCVSNVYVCVCVGVAAFACVCVCVYIKLCIFTVL